MVAHRQTFTLINRKRHNQYEFFKNISEAKKKILLIAWWAIGLFLVIILTRFYVNIIAQLPDISKIENIVFSQSTNIVDRNGKLLYKLYQENRDYVTLDKISPKMINAIIAVEDKDFWTNKGVDYMGMARAVRSDVSRSSQRQGWSTITQQLIKNVLLTRDKTITRKLKEIVLAFQIDDVIRKQVLANNKWLTNQQVERKVKEKILEMYLNYIFLGNNSYGVETASRTYFWTSANNITTLQSAILAWLPQAPSTYDPFKNRPALMWELQIIENGIKVQATGSLKETIYSKIKQNIVSINLDNRKDNEWFIKFIRGSNAFDIDFEGQSYSVKYIPGRKDTSLTRMFEEWYIDQKELKEAFIEALTFQFQKNSSFIRAPQFVFWIIDELKKKYDEELLLKGGLTIKTSLDLDIQDLAEESFKENVSNLTTYWADNTALFYADSKNWDVLAYVWSLDYNNDEIDGKVDIIQSPRQPWSSMKPLIYALGFMKLPLTIDTPIFDIPTKIGKDQPNNADWKFEWLLPLRKALWYSRNIPAIKMYFSVWEDEGVKSFLKDLGYTTFSDNVRYGYPLSIGAGEVKMIEHANAYMHLSAMWKPAKINPILEIRLSDWSILYQKKVEYQTQIIPSWVAYLIRKILSDLENLPATWVSNFTVWGLKFASKSWTTDMKMPNGQKLPRDGWLMIYTPSKVAALRAGNTNWKPMNANAYWGWVNGKARKSFFKKLLQKWYIKNENIQPAEVANVSISKISWRLATEDTPADFVISSMGYIKTLPGATDPKMKFIEIDKQCGWLRSALTPQNDIIKWYVISPVSFMPNGMDIWDIKNRWKRWSSMVLNTENPLSGDTKFQYTNIFLEEPKEVCENRTESQDDSIGIEILKPTAGSTVSKNFAIRYNISANSKIKYLKILLNDVEIAEKRLNNEQATDIMNVSAFDWVQEWTNYLSVIAIDEKGFSNKQTFDINITNTDKEAPYLLKDKISVSKNNDGTYKIILFFADDLSNIKNGSISFQWKKINSFSKNITSFEIEELWKIDIQVEDALNNKLDTSVDLNGYYKE